MMEGAVSKAIQRPIAFNYYNHRKFSATILRQSDRDISFLIVHQTTHTSSVTYDIHHGVGTANGSPR